MPATRIPSKEDLNSLSPSLILSAVYPEVPETTTAILILFHGLGDSDASFASFAKNLNLPGVLAIAVRGVSPLPPSLLGLPDALASAPTSHFHWGDDITISPSTATWIPTRLRKVERLVLGSLIRDTLIGQCGWDPRDILLFGFGQGGSVALGLASKLRLGPKVVEVAASQNTIPEDAPFKGAVSIGGPLPSSMVPTLSTRSKAKTPVLACHGKSSDDLDDEAIDHLKTEFADVREVKWRKSDDSMPKNREEMLPIMQFIAERLGGGW